VGIGSRQGLEVGTAAEVYGIQSQLERQLEGVNTDSLLSASERVQRQNSLRSALQQAVAQKLGADGFASYKGDPSVFWLKNPDEQYRNKPSDRRSQAATL
jgi:hypothetical protein